MATAFGNLLQDQENSWHISKVLSTSRVARAVAAVVTAAGQLQKELSHVAKGNTKLRQPSSQQQNQPNSYSHSRNSLQLCDNCVHCVCWWQMNLQLMLRRPVGQVQSKTRFLLVSMQRSVEPQASDSIDHIPRGLHCTK